MHTVHRVGWKGNVICSLLNVKVRWDKTDISLLICLKQDSTVTQWVWKKLKKSLKSINDNSS